MPTITLPTQKGSALNATEFEDNHRRTVVQKTANYSLLESDNRNLIECNSASPVTLTLGTASTMAGADTGDYEVSFVNIGSGVCTIVGDGVDTIDGSVSSIALSQYESVVLKVISAGTGYVSIGGGSILGLTATVDELNILDGVTSTTAELNILDGVTSTAAELNILDGVTSTAAELNILDGVTSTAAELNILDGVTSTAAELNILDGVTSTAAELNILDGVTASTAELNYTEGVTSSIQNQLDGKAGIGVNNNFTGQQRITNTAPTLFLHETGVAADSGKYYFQADSTDLTLFLMNDVETASTPVMQFARTGINSDAIDFTADNFRINGESVATQSPAVPGYVKGKAVYVSATGDNGLGINIASSAVMDAWESYGPTGSGASNIMADLDVLPAGATWVELSIRLLIRRISAPDTLVAVYARPTGSTANGILTSVVLHEAQTDAGEINVYFLHRSIKVALDAQNRFELKWDIPASGTVLSQGIIAIVTGFGA